jgi:leader peptidase (prepilin peptidase)/N-methyltransferase
MLLFLPLLILAGAAAGFGLEKILRECAVQAGYPFSRYRRSHRRWVLAAAGAAIFAVPMARFAPAVAVCDSLFLTALLGAACIDFDHLIIPDVFSVGLAVAGLAWSGLVPDLHHCGPWSLWTALRSVAAAGLGLAIGSALVLWFGLIGEMLFRKEVMGFGDVKFVGAIGAFCGWQGAVFAIFGGAALGALAFAGLALARRGGRGLRDRSGSPLLRSHPHQAGHALPCDAEAVLPFGPMLAAAAALYLLALRVPVDAYLAQYRALF